MTLTCSYQPCIISIKIKPLFYYITLFSYLSCLEGTKSSMSQVLMFKSPRVVALSILVLTDIYCTLLYSKDKACIFKSTLIVQYYNLIFTFPNRPLCISPLVFNLKLCWSYDQPILTCLVRLQLIVRDLDQW